GVLPSATRLGKVFLPSKSLDARQCFARNFGSGNVCPQCGSAVTPHERFENTPCQPHFVYTVSYFFNLNSQRESSSILRPLLYNPNISKGSPQKKDPTSHSSCGPIVLVALSRG